MGSKTNISWTDATWNPVRGCSRVSEGCRNCYAERMAGRFSGPGQPYEGLTRKTEDGPRWTGKIELATRKIDKPMAWRKPRRIFVNSMSDLFHAGVPDEFIAVVFGVMSACPEKTFQILTKRPERMAAWFDLAGTMDAPTWCGESASIARGHGGWSSVAHGAGGPWPLPNVHLGVSLEDQATADERIPLLLECPAAVRWVSAEPLLGPIDLSAYMGRAFDGMATEREYHYGLDWVVVGGESGPGHRPCDPQWITDIARQCTEAGVPAWVKQDSGPRSGTQGRIPDDVWALRQTP